jgi:hypothetical protein
MKGEVMDVVLFMMR